ncbi:N-acetylglucosaminyltransferase [Scytonema sp. UIC 10036]|uniref:beta-1,6-N-acetylglucosaminyltransferase n=1 Tax=Scytonema sp. UIC 10036 TaxID=2304196 RepID=UPI0012DA0E12|nr:beta-1,6-N-acetylglucosaminyltransferase [Scytonema sp. UIC 10036]MUH00167.1 N-acetylglucosaminyltransferase [Scytonema sp. UIC 10036]
MRVCYLIQSHKNSEQIYRLVKTIKQSSPDSFVLVSHDVSVSNLDTATLKNLSGVQIVPGLGGRGDFSIVQGYLDAVGWLFSQNIAFDWLTNLSGQDYPTRSLSQVKNFLATTQYDGFLEYFNVFSQESHWSQREGYTRYFYKYQKLKYLSTLPEWAKEIVTPIKIVNYLQPFFRLNAAYGMFGVRSSVPFNENFVCYGGSFFCTLSRQCIEYLYEFYRTRLEIVNYYKGVGVSDESFIQTVLVNSGLFNLCNDNKFYFDFSETRNGRPRLLTTDDYLSIIQNNAHFARKFDMSLDTKILDLLDEIVLEKILIS